MKKKDKKANWLVFQALPGWSYHDDKIVGWAVDTSHFRHGDDCSFNAYPIVQIVTGEENDGWPLPIVSGNGDL